MCIRSADMHLVNQEKEETNLKLVYQKADEIHEVDQFGRFKMCKEIPHESRDEVSYIRSCSSNDSSESEACLYIKILEQDS